MLEKLIAFDALKERVFIIRSKKVMIDKDLVKLCEAETKKSNQAIKRNIKHFLEDFIFQLSDKEPNELVTNCDHLRNLKYGYQNTYAFTKDEVTMLSSVLKSKQAVEINQLEQYLLSHTKNNKAKFKQIYDVLNLLTNRTKASQIGFKVD